MKLTIKTLHGLEEILANEIRDLGGEQIRVIKRGVTCEGGIRFLYQANLHLRTALKILMPVYEFTARTEQQLYAAIKKFDWTQHLEVHQTFAIEHTIFSEYFKHSQYVALRAKDAIVDGFRERLGRRPSVDRDRPDVQFNIHGFKDRFTISLDSSGEPLNRRGYRGRGHRAPMNEVLAAGLLQIAGWDKSRPLVDPMCGTGTILIEAAMLGQQMAPQLFRNHFGFKNWKNFDPMIWNRVKSEAQAAVRKTSLNIVGGDIDPNAIKMAQASQKKLGLNQQINFRQLSFERQRPTADRGVIITNPPYGERIGDEITTLYKSFSDILKNNFSGFDAWVISSNREALKHLKLKPSKKVSLYNGSLDCSFQKYELYQGSKTDKEVKK
ncbi:MAG: class I SAM-dependent RNA methyltransferase [Cyclobacteriaceae bacterium]|nr:class I SAM-dependent RNA methyltransferase [Cyclobacteriaceae bacterium HetDA_MAG_MS6]